MLASKVDTGTREFMNSFFSLSRQRLKLQHQQAMMHQEHQTMVKAVGRFMAVGKCFAFSPVTLDTQGLIHVPHKILGGGEERGLRRCLARQYE